MKKAFIFTLSGLAAILIAFALLSAITQPSEPLTSIKARDYAIFIDTLSQDNNHMFCYSYYTYTQSVINLTSQPELKTSCGVWNE